MKLDTGRDTQNPVHLGEIQTGEVQCVSREPVTVIKQLNLLAGFPINFLLVESLQRFYQYYGTDLQVLYQLLLNVT
jgi:hypothetical protein